MRTMRLFPGKYISGMVASLIILLAGGWLILAPFALGYQPYGADWTSQTTNDFVTGIAVVVVALLSFVLFFYTLLGSLRAAGVLISRPQPQAPASLEYQAQVAQSQASTSPQSDLDRTLATLAAALAADLTARRQGGNDQQNNQLVEPTTDRREA